VLSGARVIAFATHAGVAGELPGLAEPALVLTPPAGASETDDGLLTVSEAAGLRLDADLVVLSACNTAAPDGTPGAAGLSGLAKAFVHAGSRSLLVSHWAVLSDAAERLTTGMFAELAREPGLGRSEALRRSMLALLDGSGRENLLAHPAAWAPFVLVGEGGAPRPAKLAGAKRLGADLFRRS
jgi:CHAT domain-containing protein